MSSGDSDASRLGRAGAGDESAFVALVDRYQPSLSRIAALWLEDAAEIEKLIERTWLRLLHRLEPFDAQQSLKGWLCTALLGMLLEIVGPERGELQLSPEPAVAATRFSPPGDRWQGHWQAPPSEWPGLRAGTPLTPELGRVLQAAIDSLPHGERVILVLRDVEQLTAAEVHKALGLAEEPQRQLLHQARSRLRNALERHLEAQRDGGAA